MLESVLTLIESNFNAFHGLLLFIVTLILWPLAMIGTYTLTGFILDLFF
jgi:hypothetical protein